MNLSEHFTLEEMVFSEIAVRRGIMNIPTHDVVVEMTRLCREILEPLRVELRKPIIITSGYRSPLLNRFIKGSKYSDHLFGRAADIHVPGVPVLNVCKLIDMLGLPFKQCIYEGTWTHVSIPLRGQPPRRELLTAIFGRDKVTYRDGLYEP